MEFTREAWENAPEGARLEWSANIALWEKVDLIGFTKANSPVIDDHGLVRVTHNDRLRIVLSKRNVMVQLWRTDAGGFWTCAVGIDRPMPSGWTLIGAHTFEVEGE